jgi:hypothetical protein
MSTLHPMNHSNYISADLACYLLQIAHNAKNLPQSYNLLLRPAKNSAKSYKQVFGI